MFEVQLSAVDVEEANFVVADLARRHASVEGEGFQRDAAIAMHELPRTLREGLTGFRLEEPDGVCLVSGYEIDDVAIGPTPEHWRHSKNRRQTLPLEIFFYLSASLLGDPIAWATQQDGYVMHDILPIREHAHEQMGSGSAELLTWHTEDAFHPLRTDYIGLMCLRNPDAVETTYAVADDLEIDPSVRDWLSQTLYPIRPDRSHLPQNSSGGPIDPALQPLLKRSYAWITQLDDAPEPIAVMFGDPAQPYLRLDPYFMPEPANTEAAGALGVLCSAIDEALRAYALRPGEVLFVDNYRAVHGRNSFQARFDGTDRWLKRLNVARDLRRSRAARLGPAARVIY